MNAADRLAIPIETAPRLGRSARRLVVDLVGYALVSAVALGCDYGVLVLLVGIGLHYLAAAAISFLAGMIAAYALSIRFVFHDRRAASVKIEIAGFLAVGLAGLALTQGLLFALVSGLGIAVALAKLPTAGCVFLFNFVVRRSLVFAGSDWR